MVEQIFVWTLTALGITGALLNAKGKIISFYIWAPANTFWVFYFIYKEQFAPAFLFTVYAIISIIGVISWTKDNVGSRK